MTLERRLKVPDEVATLILWTPPGFKTKSSAGLDQILLAPTSGKALREELVGGNQNVL